MASGHLVASLGRALQAQPAILACTSQTGSHTVCSLRAAQASWNTSHAQGPCSRGAPAAGISTSACISAEPILASTSGASTGSLHFRIGSRSKTRSGYRESFAAVHESTTRSSSKQQLPSFSNSSHQGTGAAYRMESLQVLRVPMDRRGWAVPCKLSSTAGAKSMDPTQAPLTFEAVKVLRKLVGGMTKEGHKTLAQTIMRDALRIMQARIMAGTLTEVK
mmetsp:Transcript_15487/g.26777  ORF Transcript_15487/g.26777 Transcript_15487/m.26777 type:complete len:220 (-) Transcript_15487:948-1607(-)|eukprot:CAMPEP_0119102424 /NCGR_PEP_ID=MMETSP1180-20130426/1181_1 /TAXON_ID=3052 ORGANISM="Chlamydomonas cf sp, Strain CCMP681" /NCGR_SAMPLE_ID=MMETSP1180 /ASSEMBLY_ACC=CAM_ASM_000741 /LENGTH=219 /DNA_ID=CAMNT_0007086717 /DNA_START=57 /DNA_END=716 /DNA_ORIENTATION=-